jgi:hypothetical protein
MNLVRVPAGRLCGGFGSSRVLVRQKSDLQNSLADGKRGDGAHRRGREGENTSSHAASCRLMKRVNQISRTAGTMGAPDANPGREMAARSREGVTVAPGLRFCYRLETILG